MVVSNTLTQVTSAKPQDEKKRLERVRESLRNEWDSWEASYRELGRYLRPRMPKFLGETPNKGDRRDQYVVNNWGGLAVRTLSSGMMAGITSPSRPWFKLSVADDYLGQVKPVRVWLSEVTKRLTTVFLRSNLYQQLPKLYTSLGVFGTGAMFAEEDDETVVRFRTFAPGSYYIGVDGREQVRSFARDFQMSVRALVDKFGEENCSDDVQSKYNSENKDIWIDVVQIIEANPEHVDGKFGSKYKKYRSVYYEKANAENNDKFLRVSGYDEWPLLAPRWTTDGDDIYGTSPGWDAIGDVKELQILSRQKKKANELKIAPPLLMDPSLRGRKKSMIPRGITYVKFDGRNTGAKSLFDVNWDTNGTDMDIQSIQHRISRAFYEDLFLMLANSDRRQITATEVAERQEEKLLALGPVLETLNDELLDPIIDRTFRIMLRRGLLPEIPPELEGIDLKVEYISIMAQAMKMVGIRGMEMAVNWVSTVAAIKPETLDVANLDQMTRNYLEKVGLEPDEINTVEEVFMIRQARAQMVAQQQQQLAAQQEAETMKTLSETDTQGNNALSDLVQQRNEAAMV